MKIGLIGFGKTGKSVASVILQHKIHSLEWVIRRSKRLDKRNVSEFLGFEVEKPALVISSSKTDFHTLLEEQPVDIIIDFSSSNGIYLYGEAARKKEIKIISAISHYTQKEKRYLKELSKDTAVFWSPNITLGVNYLIFAANSLKKIAPWTDIEIIEEHFKGKEGVSGTAMKIAKELNLDETEINSIRVGGIVGRHQIVFGFPFQTVRLTHESISREAFGTGALFAAENIMNKDKGLYDFQTILKQYFNN